MHVPPSFVLVPCHGLGTFTLKPILFNGQHILFVFIQQVTLTFSSFFLHFISVKHMRTNEFVSFELLFYSLFYRHLLLVHYTQRKVAIKYVYFISNIKSMSLFCSSLFFIFSQIIYLRTSYSYFFFINARMPIWKLTSLLLSLFINCFFSSFCCILSKCIYFIFLQHAACIAIVVTSTKILYLSMLETNFLVLTL